jgi:hypothetical protein
LERSIFTAERKKNSPQITIIEFSSPPSQDKIANTKEELQAESTSSLIVVKRLHANWPQMFKYYNQPIIFSGYLHSFALMPLEITATIELAAGHDHILIIYLLLLVPFTH